MQKVSIPNSIQFSEFNIIQAGVNGWLEWLRFGWACRRPATITREIAVAPLKSSGMQAKTAPTI